MQLKEDVVLIEQNNETKTFTVVSKRTDELNADDMDGVIRQLEGSIKQIEKQLVDMEKQVEIQKKEMSQNKELFTKRLASFKEYQSQANLWKTIQDKQNERQGAPTPEEVMQTVPEAQALPAPQ